jgi:hypothetical protein
MTRPGPSPKDPSQRIRRNKDSNQSYQLSSDGSLVGPELPTDKNFGAATREFYDTWRRSPQARAFEATDWADLLLCAVMYQAVYYSGGRGPSSMMLGELRQHLSKFGATIEDRQKLRMVIEHGEELCPDTPSGLTDWASRYKPKPENG